MSKEYIDVDKFCNRYKCLEQAERNILAKTVPGSKEYEISQARIQERIYVQEDLKVFQKEEVREDGKAEWLPISKPDSHGTFECSNCGKGQYLVSRFCPDCGARMTNFVEVVETDDDD